MGTEGITTDYSRTLDERIKPATVSLAPDLDDSTERTFLDTEQGTTKFCRGFHCNATGTLVVRYAQDSVNRTLEVVQGTFYPYSCKLFVATGSTVANGDIIAMR